MDVLDFLNNAGGVAESFFSVLKPFVFMLQYCVSWHALNTQRYCLEPSGYYNPHDPSFNVLIPTKCTKAEVFNTTIPGLITVKNSSCIANVGLFGQQFDYCGYSSRPRTDLSSGLSFNRHIFLAFAFLAGIIGFIISACVRRTIRERAAQRRSTRWEKLVFKLLCYFFEVTGPWLYMRSFFNAGPRKNTYIAEPNNCNAYVYCNDFSSTLTGFSIFLTLVGLCAQKHEGAALAAVPVLALGSGIGLLVQSIKLKAPAFFTGLDFTFLQSFFSLSWARPEIYANPNFAIIFIGLISAFDLFLELIKGTVKVGKKACKGEVPPVVDAEVAVEVVRLGHGM